MIRSADLTSASEESDGLSFSKIFCRVLRDDRCWFCWWCSATFLGFAFLNAWQIADPDFFKQTLSRNGLAQNAVSGSISATEYCAVASLLAGFDESSIHGTRWNKLLSIAFFIVWLLCLVSVAFADSNNPWLSSLMSLVCGTLAFIGCGVRIWTFPSGRLTVKFKIIFGLEGISQIVRTTFITLYNNGIAFRFDGLWLVFETITIAPLAAAVLLLHFWK